MNKNLFEGKNILITGGTGSLGKVLLKHLLSFEKGKPNKIIIFSRDEAKQHALRLEYAHLKNATDEIIYQDFKNKVQFIVGDIRDYFSVLQALNGIQIVFNTAALKQVPSCEYFPIEAVNTNIMGVNNVVNAIANHKLPVETVVGISTDKAVKPVNVMGMTKALQERILSIGNLKSPNTRFVIVRYGNVLASRGSVIPLFHEQIKNGGPVTITHQEMTRFLFSLNSAVNTIFSAIEYGNPGEIFVARMPASKITTVAKALIGDRKIETRVTGLRPGEKIDEILISEEEKNKLREVSTSTANYYVIAPKVPELCDDKKYNFSLPKEYSSGDRIMDFEETVQLLKKNQLMIEDNPHF